MKFITELKRRNPLLFWFGLYNLVVAFVCLILMQVQHGQLLGVNIWLKPFKFYASVGLMILTMGWLLFYLSSASRTKRFSIVLAVTMFFENGLILIQALRHTTSHFNISTVLNALIFQLMGLLILIFTISCIHICVLFFKQKEFTIPVAYVWGIRMGLLFFIIFSLEAGFMLAIQKHTVGGTDGGPGMLLTNWSTKHGDLRIAHFFGIHALQVLPFLGYYIAQTKKSMIIIACIYFILVSLLLAEALKGLPLV